MWVVLEPHLVPCMSLSGTQEKNAGSEENHQEPHSVTTSHDKEQSRVDDYLSKIVGTGHMIKPVSLWNSVQGSSLPSSNAPFSGRSS